MAQTTGFLQHLQYGVGASTTATVGKVTGGDWGPHDSQMDYEYSIGGIPSPKLGAFGPEGSCTFWPTAAGILASAKRSTYSSAAPPALTFEGGDSSYAFRHSTAYIDTLGLACVAPDGKLQATLGWKAITPASIAVPSYFADDTGSEFHWFAAVCTLGGASCTMQSFKVDLNNNLRGGTSLDGGSSGSQRLWEELQCGNETIAGNFVVGVPPSTMAVAEAWDDMPDATVAASLAFTNALSETLTITLANLSIKTWAFNYVGPDAFRYFTIDYIGKPNASDTLTIA